MKRNVYNHKIDLKTLQIKNMPREQFRTALENVEYRGYEVETIEDGRKVVITKPGGKFVFGTVKREDFMVWVYNPIDSSLWLISHKDIYRDLKAKSEVSAKHAMEVIDALDRVCSGEDPEIVLRETSLSNPVGESPELLLKVYKWIWGQEDCNYPNGEGREMSMKDIRSLRESLK